MRLFGGRALALGLAGSLLLAGAAAAQDLSQVIGYRQGVLKAMGWHTGAVASMAKGEIAFDNAVLAHHAEALAALARMLEEGFPEGSVGVANSRAKADIDSNRAVFLERVAALETATAALAAAAPTMSADQLGAALGQVGGTCKACHDQFRN